LNLKKRLAKQTGRGFLKNSAILKIYRELLSEGKINKKVKFENLIRLKKVRTLSGVAPVAVLTKPYPCPGECVYCPIEPGIPKSYLSDEPAVERAKRNKFDPFLQVKSRIEQYRKTGHQPEKIELIVIGGSFSYLPEDYKIWFIKRCFDAVNQKDSPNLNQAQKLNQKAKYRIIGITLETRPDMINKSEIKLMRHLGGTRVEIGVQHTDDRVLKQVKRGHGAEESIRATQLLKDAGFKVCYHMMPSLPGSDVKKDLAVFKQIFSKPAFKPDMLKIYPCVVLKEAELYDWFKSGRYLPCSDKELINLLMKIKSGLPRWVRVNRLIRDIPADYIMAGSKVSNLRQVVQEKMKKTGLKCQCVRCREIRNKQFKLENLKLKITKYKASNGQEYFLEYVDNKDRLYALLRLRLVKDNCLKNVFPVLDQAGIVREVHTFGRALSVGGKGKVQHQGLGESLLRKAEQVAKKAGFRKMVVISGVGARDYYRKFSYRLSQTYMVKDLQ